MFKRILVFFTASTLTFVAPTSTSAESYQQYLERLLDICSVDCLQPRRFQIAARKRSSNAVDDMALIMDVVEVRQVGDKFELHNIAQDTSALSSWSSLALPELIQAFAMALVDEQETG